MKKYLPLIGVIVLQVSSFAIARDLGHSPLRLALYIGALLCGAYLVSGAVLTKLISQTKKTNSSNEPVTTLNSPALVSFVQSASIWPIVEQWAQDENCLLTVGSTETDRLYKYPSVLAILRVFRIKQTDDAVSIWVWFEPIPGHPKNIADAAWFVIPQYLAKKKLNNLLRKLNVAEYRRSK